MSHGPPAGRRLPALLGGLLLAAGMVAMILGAAAWSRPAVPSKAGDTASHSPSRIASRAPSPAATPAEPTPAEPVVDRMRHKATGIRPIRVRIPAIDVAARVIDLGLTEDGTLEVPGAFDEAGWWTGGTKPGAAGPAVVVGHVDSRAGPGVFYRLRDVDRGDRIKLRDRSGRVVRFAVDRVEQHPKDDFPTDAVYGDTEQPTLRLITCGGPFNQSARSYVDNVIVYASLAG